MDAGSRRASRVLTFSGGGDRADRSASRPGVIRTLHGLRERGFGLALAGNGAGPDRILRRRAVAGGHSVSRPTGGAAFR